MKRILLPFIIILLMSGNTAWAGGLFPGTSGVSDAKDVKFDNTEASLTGDPDDVQTAIEAVKTEIGNIEAGGLADIDDLPGDTIDNNLIDKALVQDSENWDTAFGWGNHASEGYAAGDHDHALTYALIDHTHDYSSVFEAKDTTILKSGTTLGTFTGTTIPDSQTISQALQALETAIEGIEVGGLSDLDDLPGDSVDDNLIDAALLADLSSIYSTTGHTHTGSTISGIDISDDTNLSGDTEIVLTGDALSIASGITRDAEWDSIAEIEAATGVNIIVNTEIDSLAEINAIVGVTLLSTSSGIDASNINSGTIGVAYLPSDLSSMTSLILPSNTTVAHETGVADSSSYMSADDTHTVTVSAPASMADDADLTWPTSDGVLAIIADIEALIDDTAGIGNEALVWSADKIAGELASIRSTMGTGTGDMLLGTEQVVTALKTFNNDTLSAGGIKFDSTPDAAGEVGYATAAYRFLGGATIEDIHFHATENLWTIGSDTGATFAFTPSVTFTAGGIIGTTSHLQFGDSGTYIAQLNDGHLDLEADISIDLNAPIVIGGDVALGTNKIQSTGNIVLQLGDAAGTNKLSIQDSGGNEVYSINSDGQATAIAGANPALTLGDSDAPGSEAADKQVGQLWSEYVSGDPDEENSSIGLKAMVAGTLTDIFWYGAASDTVWSARDLDVTGEVYTSGGIDFGGAQTPNMQAGLLTWDTLISGVNSGGLVWNDGATTRIIVDIPSTTTLTDGHAVVYESDDGGHFTLAEAGSGSMVYPSTGIPVSTGSAWGTSLTVGTGASNLVQLDESGKLPAVDGSSLTGLGGDQLVDIVTTAPLLVNGGANVNDVLPGSDADITFSVQDASTSQKGVAQFSSDNFADSSGTITIKDNGIAAAEIADLYGFELIPIAWAADGTSAPDALNDTGRKPWKYRTFASDADEDVNFIWQIPSDADVGASVNNFWYRVHYLIVNATGPSATEGVAFSLAGVCINDNGATNAAKGSAVTVTDDELNASQWDYMRTDWSSAVAITTASAGSICELNLERTTADAVDDYGQDVGVAFIEIRYVKNPTR